MEGISVSKKYLIPEKITAEALFRTNGLQKCVGCQLNGGASILNPVLQDVHSKDIKGGFEVKGRITCQGINGGRPLEGCAFKYNRDI